MKYLQGILFSIGQLRPMKHTYSILTILILAIHLYILLCTSCSRIFVWWDQIYLRPRAQWLIVIVSILTVVTNYVGVTLYPKVKSKYTLALACIFCIISIAYWGYVILFARVMIQQYLVLCAIHFVWLCLYISIGSRRLT